MRPALHPLLAALAALCTLGLPGLGPPPLAAAPAVSTSNRGPVGTLALASYLSKFGYIPKLDPQSPHLRALTGGIKDLQRFAGLPATGVVDAALEELLRRPRCGMLDMDGAGRASRARRHVPRHALRQLEQLRHAHRRRRYTARQDMKWHNTLEVSWSLAEHVPGGLDRARMKLELRHALELWAKPSKLRFREDDVDPMIRVSFQRGNHSDAFPFDGPGNVLAHAFFPGTGLGGDVHLDADETWLMVGADSRRTGTSLFGVLAHEFGHSLGLMHSSVNDSLMYPWYRYENLDLNYQLPIDDTRAIQQLYGSRDDRLWARIPEYKPVGGGGGGGGGGTGSPPRVSPPRGSPPREPSRPPPPRRPGVTAAPPIAPPYQPPYRDPDMPDTCNTAYDAVAHIRGELFIFKGKYQWRIRDGRLLPGYPVKTSLLWRGLPDNFTHVDAVYQRSDLKIVFFIGKRYWVYSGNEPDPGYPRPLAHLGLPPDLSHIDDAVVWGYNGKTYLFSGTMYWRLDDDSGTVELDYPRDMSIWRGVGYNIDAVFQWKDGYTYFFKGKGFWKFNDLQMRVENRMPKNSASFWMGANCPEPEGRWNDWEENSVDIYNDIGGKSYDQFDYDDDYSSSAPSHLSAISALCLSLSCSLYFALRL